MRKMNEYLQLEVIIEALVPSDTPGGSHKIVESRDSFQKIKVGVEKSRRQDGGAKLRQNVGSKPSSYWSPQMGGKLGDREGGAQSIPDEDYLYPEGSSGKYEIVREVQQRLEDLTSFRRVAFRAGKKNGKPFIIAFTGSGGLIFYMSDAHVEWVIVTDVNLNPKAELMVRPLRLTAYTLSSSRLMIAHRNNSQTLADTRRSAVPGSSKISDDRCR
ncbi:hypothetical protein DFH09DRAFT_1071422 [Mycena vulgaris]|nr:hypothetical protein DFH09DRAFT_1071422 [Mycena vulgaris]